MANITFIIGNGLDIALGLKTSYKDFYKYVQLNNLHPKNKIYQSINNDPDTWSDFELSLGAYTRYIEDIPEVDRVLESKAFHNELEEVTLDLVKYLEKEGNNINEETVNHGITKTSFFEGLSSGQIDQILPITRSGDPLYFNFITLNYTFTLEKILSKLGVLLIPQKIILSEIHHLHGDLSEDVTLGVNDEYQMSSAIVGIERDDLIKPLLIASMDDGRIQRMVRILENSSIVVLFGTSIGETDKYIWESLVRWQTESKNRYIIIHKHDKNYTGETRMIPRRKKLFRTEVQNLLLNKTAFGDSIKEGLRKRIFVIHNTDKLFRKK